MQQRLGELDFLKGVFIILMITFHLVNIGDSYPYAKRVVYTFHMPGFLIISGYLMNITKPCKDLIKTMLSYAIPYIVMESGYIVMAAVSPSHRAILVFADFDNVWSLIHSGIPFCSHEDQFTDHPAWNHLPCDFQHAWHYVIRLFTLFPCRSVVAAKRHFLHRCLSAIADCNTGIYITGDTPAKPSDGGVWWCADGLSRDCRISLRPFPCGEKG